METNNPKPAPITTDEFDRRFDAGEDISDYIDWESARRVRKGTKPMKQFFELDPCPTEEDGAQVGHNSREELAAEAMRFKAQILAAYPPVNEHCRVSIHWNHHDFGIYPEIRIWWDDSDEPSMEWAIRIEDDAEEKLVRWAE